MDGSRAARVVCTPADRSIVRAGDGGSASKMQFRQQMTPTPPPYCRYRLLSSLVRSSSINKSVSHVPKPKSSSRPDSAHASLLPCPSFPSQCSVLTLMKQKPRFLRRFSKASIIKIENEGIGCHQTLNELHNLKNPRSQAISELKIIGSGEIHSGTYGLVDA